MLLLVIPFTIKASILDKSDGKRACSESFMFDSDIVWENAGKGVKRKILGYDGKLMLVKIQFDKEAIGSVHTHKHTQTTYVVSGKFEFTIGGEKKIVTAGDGLYMPPNVEHECVCLESGILIDCFSPMRTDFINEK